MMVNIAVLAPMPSESVLQPRERRPVRAEETQRVGEVVCHSIAPLEFLSKRDVSVDSTFIWSVDVYRR